jgi:hypothetical protein
MGCLLQEIPAKRRFRCVAVIVEGCISGSPEPLAWRRTLPSGGVANIHQPITRGARVQDRKADFVTVSVTRDEDRDLMDAVRQLAYQTDRSRSAIVRLALRDYIDRHRPTTVSHRTAP